jgi:hypothetical protein
MKGAGGNPFVPDPAAEKDQAQLEHSLAVQTISLSPQPRPGGVTVEVEVRNYSGKTITAHWGFVTARYADGKEATQIWNEDLLMATVIAQLPGVTAQSPKTLRAGETRKLVVQMPAGADGSAPVHLSGSTSALLFEDRTALGHPAQIAVTLDSRRSHAEDLRDEFEGLRAVRAHSNVLAAIRENREPVSALRQAVAEQIRKPAAAPGRGDSLRLAALHQLEQAMSIPLPKGFPPEAVLDLLDLMIRSAQAQQSVTSEHSTLKEAR